MVNFAAMNPGRATKAVESQAGRGFTGETRGGSPSNMEVIWKTYPKIGKKYIHIHHIRMNISDILDAKRMILFQVGMMGVKE